MMLDLGMVLVFPTGGSLRRSNLCVGYAWDRHWHLLLETESRQMEMLECLSPPWRKL